MSESDDADYPSWKEYALAVESFRVTEGRRVQDNVDSRWRSFYIFQKNYEELLQTLDINFADFLTLEGEKTDLFLQKNINQLGSGLAILRFSTRRRQTTALSS